MFVTSPLQLEDETGNIQLEDETGVILANIPLTSCVGELHYIYDINTTNVVILDDGIQTIVDKSIDKVIVQGTDTILSYTDNSYFIKEECPNRPRLQAPKRTR